MQWAKWVKNVLSKTVWIPMYLENPLKSQTPQEWSIFPPSLHTATWPSVIDAEMYFQLCLQIRYLVFTRPNSSSGYICAFSLIIFFWLKLKSCFFRVLKAAYVASPPKPSIFSPSPHGNGIWRWDLWVVIRLRGCHEGEAPWWGYCHCKKWEQGELVRTRWEGSSVHARKRVLTEGSNCLMPWSWTSQAPALWEMNFFYSRHPA